jgi:putative zinc finger protein
MTNSHEAVGSYLTDALDPAERAEFEEHLSSCARCWREVGELREAVAELAALTSAPPPPELRATVLELIRESRPLPPEGGAGNEDPYPFVAPLDEHPSIMPWDLPSPLAPRERREPAGRRGRKSTTQRG